MEHQLCAPLVLKNIGYGVTQTLDSVLRSASYQLSDIRQLT